MRKIVLLLPTLLIMLNNSGKIDYFNVETIASRGRLHYMYNPKDPYYTGEKKVGNIYYQRIAMDYIGDINSIWDNYTGKGVTVAVIDSGIDINSPDFEGKISNKSAYFYTVYEDEEDPYSDYQVFHDMGIEHAQHVLEENGKYIDHGSLVSGVIAAKNDDYGVVGVAFDAEILAIRMDLQDYSVNEAVKYAVDNGADVINLSLGSYAEPYYSNIDKKFHNKEWEDYYPGSDLSMVEGINYAVEHNVIVVAAAGNEATSTKSYPAANEGVIGVGASEINTRSTLASYSNFNSKDATEYNNSWIDVVAPGTVVSDGYDGNSILDISLGTSFACPIVAGVASLYKEKYPDCTVEQFKQALVNGAYDSGATGWDNKFGYGTIDVEGILAREGYINLLNHELTLEVDKTAQFPAEIVKTTTNPAYFSDNEEIATISNDGMITALKEGTCNLTITVEDMSKEVVLSVYEKDVPPVDPEPDPDIPPAPARESGCGGDIVFTSSALSIFALFTISLLLIKKSSKNS